MSIQNTVFSEASTMEGELWSVVLAAGRGRRLTRVTQGTPKQFWRPDDGPSLLEDTFARIAPLAPRARTAVVVDRSHRRYVETAEPWPADWILYQPEDRGTAVGVLLALSHVLDVSPDAVVLLTPSDHGVASAAAFRAGVVDAVAAVRSGKVDVVLFGVEPSEAATDYGWITPGPACHWANDRPLRSVAAFVEKPAAALARRLFSDRALWNTMVLVARAATLLDLYKAHLPHWEEVFAIYRRLSSRWREAFLVDRYADLPAADFSRDILTLATGLSVYSWEESLGWSDLGTPDRLQRWIGGTLAQPRPATTRPIGLEVAAS